MCDVSEKMLSVREAVERTDRLFPNVFSFAVKALWLDELDKRIHRELLSLYEDAPKPSEASYCENPDTALLAGDEFSGMYTAYLVMQFDIVNADITRYTNSATLFNNFYIEYMKHINRSHKATQKSINIE